MAISPVLALGLVAQSVFIGGNITLSSVFVPVIRQKDVPPKLQVKLWESLFDSAAKLMAGSSAVTFLSYVYEAYSSAAGSATRQSAIITAVLSIAVMPFTLTVILSSVRKLKALARLGEEQELEEHQVGPLIDYWNKLSVVRTLIFCTGYANTLYYLIKN